MKRKMWGTLVNFRHVALFSILDAPFNGFASIMILYGRKTQLKKTISRKKILYEPIWVKKVQIC